MKPPKLLIKSVNIRLRECVLTFDGAHTPTADYKLISLKTKICTKCGEVKGQSEFYKNHKTKDGRRRACKACCYISEKKYRPNNTEKLKAKNRKYYIEHKEQNREYNREKSKRFRIEHPDIVKNYRKRYYAKNKQIAVKRATKWAVKNRGKIRTSQKDSIRNLIDSYVKSKITQRSLLVSTDIPQELIEVKREYIRLRRLLKGIENENYEGSQRKTG